MNVTRSFSSPALLGSPCLLDRFCSSVSCWPGVLVVAVLGIVPVPSAAAHD